MPQIPCVECGATFTDQTDNRRKQRFCSSRCWHAFMRIHRKKPDGLTRYQRYYRNHVDQRRAEHVSRLDKPNYRYARLKAGATERGIDFAITKAEFAEFWQKPCHYCGATIARCGIDRIDSSKGYVMGNLVPCCKKCNLMKREYTASQFVLHCQRIVEFNQPVHT